ncbi:MAG: ATP-binding cassette domain-containing protein [Desulfobacterota bacterium]|nr:ATP-binding cassette domain-containing protein [Thermodesulfobacteriota bacterium]
MEGYLFKVEDLSQVFAGRKVLNIPWLAFLPQRIHAITGPNGSGKTTFCHILSLLLRPTTGKVWYQGKDVYENGRLAEKLRKKITMVHQNPFLFNTTVEKNLVYGLKIRNYSRSQQKQKIEELLSLLGIKHLRHQRARRLSGGEAQRVAMARALIIEPEVLILDEFTANVDRNYVNVMEEIIQNIFWGKKGTVFLVTHNENQALRLAHTLTYLIDGEVVEHRNLA